MELTDEEIERIIESEIIHPRLKRLARAGIQPTTEELEEHYAEEIGDIGEKFGDRFDKNRFDGIKERL